MLFCGKITLYYFFDGGENVITRSDKRPFRGSLGIVAKVKPKLDQNGTRLLLILGILICIVVTISLAVMCVALYETLPLSQLWGEAIAITVFDGVQILLTFFLAFPLYLGVLRGADALRRGKRVEIVDFFIYYASFSALMRAWGIQIRILWNAFPMVVGLLLGFVPLYSEWIPFYDTVRLVINVATPLLCLCGVLSACRIFPFAILAVRNDERSLGNCSKQAKRMTRGKFSSILILRLRMVMGLLLSLLSIGVITLIHTLPLTLLAYGELVDMMEATFEI